MKTTPRSVLAFLDILGYQSFLEGNRDNGASAVHAAEEVFSLLQKSPHEAAAFWRKLLGAEPRLVASYEKLKSMVFSDTIIIHIPVEHEDGDELATFAICTTASFMTEKLFEYGLPVRGVITHGEFISRDSCIAGRGVVDAHKQASRLDFSGVALSPRVSALISRSIMLKDAWDWLAPNYLMPLKTGEERGRVLRWFPRKSPTNYAAVVRKSFWKLGKEIPSNVESKIFNTAKMLEYFDQLPELA